MSSLNGVFSLRKPRDLLGKLQHDYQRLTDAADPTGLEAQYAAVDFFITANHLLEWNDKTPRASKVPTGPKPYRDRELVSDIANGAKHLTARERKHEAQVHRGAFDPRVFARGVFNVSRLIVKLENGTTGDDVLDVAARVLAYWRPSR